MIARRDASGYVASAEERSAAARQFRVALVAARPRSPSPASRRRSRTRCRARTSPCSSSRTARSAIQETITFLFLGPFTGAYRDIPLRDGESADRVSVAESGTFYRPGGCTELGCDDAAGTYGVERTANRIRIVWHYRAEDEQRTFTIRYRLRGVAVAYDDVVDVNLQVWGGHWPVGVGYLTATDAAPGVRAARLGPPRLGAR